MAQFDLGGVLGAVLGGKPATRGTTRRRNAPFGNRDLVRAVGMLAGVAIEAMAKAQQAPPAPAPPKRTGSGGRGSEAPPMAKPAPTSGGAKAPAAAPRGSVPPSGPWGGAAAGKPAAGGAWAPVPGVPDVPAIAAEDRESVLMLRAMIAAAKADGLVDAEERGRIAGQLEEAGLGAAARAAVLAEFERGATAAALAREAADPMLAAQVYAAAVAGAGSIEGAERGWLDDFAKALRLDRAATEAIERRIRGG